MDKHVRRFALSLSCCLVSDARADPEAECSYAVGVSAVRRVTLAFSLVTTRPRAR
ncbi:hypothetical protein GCM10009847_13740 [Leucobacter tardus]